MRYPEDGVVLLFEDDNRHALSPKLLIPNKENIQVEVSVIAAPKDISNEAINVIGYIFTEIVTTIIPGQKLGKVLTRVADYTIGRTTDEAKAYIQEGRLVGYASISANQLARQGYISSPEFHVKASLQHGSGSNIPASDTNTSTGSTPSHSDKLNGRILEPSNNAIVGRIVTVSGELTNLSPNQRAFLCIKSTAFSKKIYPQEEIIPTSDGKWSVRSIYGTEGYDYETFIVVTDDDAAIAILHSEENTKNGIERLPQNTTRIGVTIIVHRE